MRALTITPGQPDTIRLVEIPEPPLEEGSILVQTVAVGVCGTDIEEVAGGYGWPPPGRDRLVLGHESLGRVLSAPAGSDYAPGDLVVGIVRRPDPIPCRNCAAGEWDMCLNGRYTEHGIKELDGFCRERFRMDPHFLVKVPLELGLVGVLTEPASVVAKAWEQIEKIGLRTSWKASRVLVTGAGPIGLLAALMGVQRGYQVSVLDRVAAGPKPDLIRDLGATYSTASVQDLARDADIIIECTGAGQLLIDLVQVVPPCSIVCLTGISSGKRVIPVDVRGLERLLVLENEVIFGSVNANRRHYEQATAALAAADPAWLDRVITRKVPLAQWAAAYSRQPEDVKTVIVF